MSTTTPSSSSSRRRKVASTTKVAPCRRCAGPNVSPRRLCAIIMWSRTVVLYTRSDLLGLVLGLVVGLRVADAVADRRQIPGNQPRQDAGQLVEPGLPRDQDVEGRVGQQPEGQREALRAGAAVPPRGRHGPHLAAAQ